MEVWKYICHKFMQIPQNQSVTSFHFFDTDRSAIITLYIYLCISFRYLCVLYICIYLYSLYQKLSKSKNLKHWQHSLDQQKTSRRATEHLQMINRILTEDQQKTDRRPTDNRRQTLTISQWWPYHIYQETFIKEIKFWTPLVLT